MPSPFPGMDPYLEDPTRWGGVHLGLIYAIQTELNRVLPVGLFAEIDQYVRVEESDSDDVNQLRNPNVFVPEPLSPVTRIGSSGGSTAVIAAPNAVFTLLPGTIQKHRRVTIQTTARRDVLTAIEVLSPSNKTSGQGRDAYLLKRNEYLASGTNLVEIDLLRDGERLPFGRPRPPSSDYYIFVSPADRRPKTSVWSFTLQERIPVFPVPIRPDLGAVPLDLRVCLDRIYEDGRFATKLQYTCPPNPELDAPRSSWANDLLAKYLSEQNQE